MNRLSAVIITYNEEKNIARCLESLRSVADEIVVVDSFSTDHTKKICKSYRAKFIEHEFEGHIQQKNFAVSRARYPFILSIDADEALSDELKASILAVKSSWNYDGYTMNRLTNYCGTWILHCGWYPDKKLRLFDPRKGEWKGMNPHDKLEMTEPGSRVQHLEGDILHYSYNSISDHLKQVDYFTEISARTLFEKGKNASVLKVIISPIARFLRDYFWKLGFLDGYYGLVICAISSHAAFVKYVKLRELHRKTRRK